MKRSYKKYVIKQISILKHNLITPQKYYKIVKYRQNYLSKKVNLFAYLLVIGLKSVVNITANKSFKILL